MLKLTKKNRANQVIPETYYTLDYKFEIERGTVGWNINEVDKNGWYHYSFSTDTLKEARETIEYGMNHPEPMYTVHYEIPTNKDYTRKHTITVNAQDLKDILTKCDNLGYKYSVVEA